MFLLDRYPWFQSSFLKACLVACAMSLALATPADAWPRRKAIDPGVDAATIIVEIEKALDQADKALKGDTTLPDLQSVTIVLETAYAKGASGKLGWWVISVEGSRSRIRSQKLTLVWTKQTSAQVGALGVAPSLAKDLEKAIINAAKVAKEAKAKARRLNLNTVKIQIKFVVKTEGKAGGAFAILPINIGLRGNISKTAIHSVTVTYK